MEYSAFFYLLQGTGSYFLLQFPLLAIMHFCKYFVSLVCKGLQLESVSFLHSKIVVDLNIHLHQSFLFNKINLLKYSISVNMWQFPFPVLI